jgi:GNAT superfamily N-acetyltransferase
MQGGDGMIIDIHNCCTDYDSYRAARVKSLFNVESGADFKLVANVDIDDVEWGIGVVVGPSGSGKSSIGRKIWEGAAYYEPGEGWPKDAPIVDAIAPDGDFDALTGALSSVGLGDVPAWLRPYHVLSNGERFRADLARIISEAPPRIVIDEFSSVVDRQIAKIGANAFAKAWRRTKGQAVLLSCHYDILDWVEPDWIFDTEAKTFERDRARGALRRRPRFELEIFKTNWMYWPEFKPHHYLDSPPMIAACCYVGVIDSERVCHIGMTTKNRAKQLEARACRMVVKPEWQGAGVGMRFLNAVCQAQADGHELARIPGRPMNTLFHTSHPGLAMALRRDPKWRQLSGVMWGGNAKRSGKSIAKGTGITSGKLTGNLTGYGGHFRAVQGFRYYGGAK